MARHNNWQSDNFKYDKTNSRTNIYNPDFLSGVKPNENKINSFHDNLDKWILFMQWAR